MQCPSCRSDNREEARFCQQCGQKLQRRCPSCARPCEPESRFCDECGLRLDAAAPQSASGPVTASQPGAEEQMARIRRYLPSGLAERILSQKEKIEGERRQVTVMFCDLAGFTALSERLGPEEAYRTMDQVYEILIHKVHDFGGTVNEMTGDGIMALFGAPVALEDAPQRAIRAGHAIHLELTRFNQGVRQAKPDFPPLRMRIGINSGPVVVGSLGNDLRVEFKAVGDTVNLASRMEQLAEPGTTCVSEATFKLTEGFFRFEALGAREVKGKDGRLRVYRVVAPSSTQTRFDVSAERGLTRFVGRARELELLLDGLERAKTGRGQAVSILAEAGVGKSRLLYEFQKAIANEDITFLEGRCLSYSRNVAYHPIIDILKSNFRIQEGDGALEIREKVAKGLRSLTADQASTLPCLLELFSVKPERPDPIPTSPEAHKERVIETVTRITLKGSELRPLVLVYEDLHWVDQSSEDVLRHVLEHIPAARILMIFTFRPEFLLTWGGRSYHSQTMLNRLSNRETLAMVTHILGTETIAPDLEDLILEKTEGIPFFIEEFIRSLQELKILQAKEGGYYLAKDLKHLSVPSTIQEVIMARVDALPEKARLVLQAASAIEREFPYDLIKEVAELPENELFTHLSALKDSELVYERGIHPASTFIFKHALTREVVYDSILEKKRGELHAVIGRAMEKLRETHLEEHFGSLARHFLAGKDHERGAKYSSLAGQKAQQKGAYGDAVAYLEDAALSLERLPRTDETEKRLIDARVTLGLYYNQMVDPVSAKKAIDPVSELAARHNYRRRIAQILTLDGTYAFMIEGDYPRAFASIHRALEVAGQIGDSVSMWVGNHWLGHAYAENCQFDQALQHLEGALELNVEKKILWGIAVVKACIGNTVYNNQGRADLGYRICKEGLELAEDSGDALSKAEAYVYYGCSCFLRGFLQEAKDKLEAGIVFWEKLRYLGMSGFGYFCLAETCYHLGQYDVARKNYRQAISQLDLVGIWPSLSAAYRIASAKAEIMAGRNEVDLQSFREHVSSNRMKICEGMMARSIGELLLQRDADSRPEAEAWIRKAMEADERNGMTWWHLASDHFLYAQLFKKRGDRESAQVHLARAAERFQSCGAEGWAERCRTELAGLS